MRELFGSGAQRNMEPLGGVSTGQPARFMPSTSTSRRFWYMSQILTVSSSHSRRATMEAICMGWNDAVIQVALDARQRVDDLRVAQAIADAPAGHVVALRHGEDLDGVLLGAIHLEDAGRLVAVEADVGVGEIVDHHGAMLWPARTISL
jgi:hypothetical protein